jgi:hypothetical protein
MYGSSYVSALHCHRQGAFTTHHVTRHNTPIHNILSIAPHFSISQKALGTLPEDSNVMYAQLNNLCKARIKQYFIPISELRILRFIAKLRGTQHTVLHGGKVSITVQTFFLTFKQRLIKIIETSPTAQKHTTQNVNLNKLYSPAGASTLSW